MVKFEGGASAVVKRNGVTPSEFTLDVVCGPNSVTYSQNPNLVSQIWYTIGDSLDYVYQIAQPTVNPKSCKVQQFLIEEQTINGVALAEALYFDTKVC